MQPIIKSQKKENDTCHIFINDNFDNGILYSFLVSISLLISYFYFSQISYPAYSLRVELHQKIINGIAESPYKYRILVPFILEGFIKVFSSFLSLKVSFIFSYSLFESVLFFIFFKVLFDYLRLWFNKEQALLGILFVAFTMPITFKDHYFQPWSYIEPIFYILALKYLYEKKYLYFLVILILASLNRETSVFLVLLYLFTNPEIIYPIKFSHIMKAKSALKNFVLILALWLIIFYGIRYIRGGSQYVQNLIQIWFQNASLSNLWKMILQIVLFLGIFWYFAVKGYRFSNEFIKRATMILPFYILFILIFGIWREVRLLMPLYPILIPMGLSFLYKRKEKLE